jgi:hypothetical protein
MCLGQARSCGSLQCINKSGKVRSRDLCCATVVLQGQREVNAKDKFIFWWSLYLTVSSHHRCMVNCKETLRPSDFEDLSLTVWTTLCSLLCCSLSSGRCWAS